MKHFSLRKLQKKDAPLMLEWMHDNDVVNDLQTNFTEKTLDDCLHFIDLAANEKNHLHLAIVNDVDEYLGTVSLKSIVENSAEFAITIRKIAMGSGCSSFAMQEIIKKGLYELGLKEIYWCVSKVNGRAVRFYDKNNYERVSLDNLLVDKKLLMETYSTEQMDKYIWYHVIR